MALYVLYKSLASSSNEKMHEAATTDWTALAKEYGLKLLRERPTMATVEAVPEAIEMIQKTHPDIQVTREKKYHKA